jgi:metallopeptidase YgjP-like protein
MMASLVASSAFLPISVLWGFNAAPSAVDRAVLIDWAASSGGVLESLVAGVILALVGFCVLVPVYIAKLTVLLRRTKSATDRLSDKLDHSRRLLGDEARVLRSTSESVSVELERVKQEIGSMSVRLSDMVTDALSHLQATCPVGPEVVRSLTTMLSELVNIQETAAKQHQAFRQHLSAQAGAGRVLSHEIVGLRDFLRARLAALDTRISRVEGALAETAEMPRQADPAVLSSVAGYVDWARSPDSEGAPPPDGMVQMLWEMAGGRPVDVALLRRYIRSVPEQTILFDGGPEKSVKEAAFTFVMAVERAIQYKERESVTRRGQHGGQELPLMPSPPVGLPAEVCLLAAAQKWRVFYQERGRGGVKVEELGWCRLLVSGRLSGNDKACRRALVRWLARKADEHLRPNIERLCKDAGLELATTRFSTRMKKRLGKGAKTGSLTLHPGLLLLSARAALHVVCHELCHTVYPSHSSGFWNLLRKLSDDNDGLADEFGRAIEELPDWLK